MRVCAVEGCPKPTTQRSRLCAMHRSRRTRYGDPLQERAKPREKDLTCTVEGCEQPRRGKGLCGKHWQQRKRRGDPVASPRKVDWTAEETRKVKDLLRDESGRINPYARCRYGEAEALSLHLDGRSAVAIRCKLHKLRLELRNG